LINTLFFILPIIIVFAGPERFDACLIILRSLILNWSVPVLICKHGRNITADEADSYIGGLMIMNDVSARQLQMEEMLLNLGPAKGKDFCTAIGPWLVTLDELEPFEIAAKKAIPVKTGI
jgi:fumarylacetoacetate (FAA) hydrolase